MENAVDALKVAFAILIFALAIALTFSVISNIRHTSDVLFEMSDSNKYYIEGLEGYTYITAGTDDNRQVGVETIIPTIYRYYKENFGVTIIDRDMKPVARFDLDTENIVNNWLTNNDETNQLHIDYLNTYVNPNRLKSNNGYGSDIWSNASDVRNNLYNLAPTNLYIMNQSEISKRKIATPWIGSDQRILDRIRADIYGGTIEFDSNTTYKGNDLIEYLNSNTFTEYFVFVPALKSDGTKDYDKTDKLEIIYVQE